jgi:hypothetical protein
VVGWHPRFYATVGAAIVGTSTAAAAQGQAHRHRLALATEDPALLRAVGLALDVWDVDVVAVPAARPEAPLVEWAAAIATTWQVDVVVWMNPAGGVVWYDASTRQVETRDLGLAQPLDASEAAAVALMLKAELVEELEAKVASTAPTTLPPMRDLAPPPAVRGPTPAPGRATSIASWEGVAGAGVRWVGDGQLEARGWAGARVFPSVAAGHFGLGVDVAAGPGVALASPAFHGRWIDVTLSPTLRARFRVARRTAVESAVGASAHFTSIDGTAAIDDSARSAGRVDASLDLSINASMAVAPWLEIGAGAGVEVWLRHETFVVRGVPVLALTDAPLQAGAFLRLRSE